MLVSAFPCRKNCDYHPIQPTLKASTHEEVYPYFVARERETPDYAISANPLKNGG
ncbi:MAG: hypothetical protein NVS4B7_18600 [Ktedonobacteraceae bacterium]